MIAKLEWMLTKEAPEGYAARSDFIYEVVLKTAGGEPWLNRPECAQKVLQALLLIQKMLEIEWLDILLWQDGLYLRLRLGRASNLMEVLSLLREKSSPSAAGAAHWEDEPSWVRMVTPEHSPQANRLMWEKMDSLLGALKRMPQDAATLFFYHQGGGPVGR